MKYKNVSTLNLLLLLNKTTAQHTNQAHFEISSDGSSKPLIKEEKTNKDLLKNGKRKLALQCFEQIVNFEKNNDILLSNPSFSYLLKDNISEEEKIDKSAYCKFPILPLHFELKNPLTIIDFDRDRKLIECVKKFKKNSVGKTDDEKIYLINNHAIKFFDLAGNNFDLKKPESGEILLGDFPKKYQAVCIQFALFAKILCDELNTNSIKCSVVKGYFNNEPHSWNEITIKDYKSKKTTKFLFDIAQQKILLPISKSNNQLKSYKKNNSNKLIKNENKLHDMFFKIKSFHDKNLYNKQYDKIMEELYQKPAYN